MIDVARVLADLPSFETFCSVDKLHEFVNGLRDKSGFDIQVAGYSPGGAPIHHVRYGSGTKKALFVAYPHCMEPIGGLTVYALMHQLSQGNPALLGADVEWHIVPCIDPDGARLNEGWTQQPFSLDAYIQNYYVQAHEDQVDGSFPITYKKLSYIKPSPEAIILKSVIDSACPDFFFSLHNDWAGGAFFFVSRDIGPSYYQSITDMLGDLDFPVKKNANYGEVCKQYHEGFFEIMTTRKWYDYIESTTPVPEKLVKTGANSWEYLQEINPSALTFVAELGYVRHPSDGSPALTGKNLRRFKLALDADLKWLATLLRGYWQQFADQLDSCDPLYRLIAGGMAFPLDEDQLLEGGLPLARYPTRDILSGSQYDREMTEGDRFKACAIDGGLYSLRLTTQFVRLLRNSPQTEEIKNAVSTLENAHAQLMNDFDDQIDFSKFQITDCNTLAKVQIGSGLHALNSIL